MENQARESVKEPRKSFAHIKRNCSQDTPQAWWQVLDWDSIDSGGNIVANDIYTHALCYRVLTIFYYCTAVGVNRPKTCYRVFRRWPSRKTFICKQTSDTRSVTIFLNFRVFFQANFSGHRKFPRWYYISERWMCSKTHVDNENISLCQTYQSFFLLLLRSRFLLEMSCKCLG